MTTELGCKHDLVIEYLLYIQEALDDIPSIKTRTTENTQVY